MILPRFNGHVVSPLFILPFDSIIVSTGFGVFVDMSCDPSINCEGASFSGKNYIGKYVVLRPLTNVVSS